MKRIALEGFTREDAFRWLASEARLLGCAVRIRDIIATLGPDLDPIAVVTTMGPKEMADPSKFDQIITRGEVVA